MFQQLRCQCRHRCQTARRIIHPFARDFWVINTICQLNQVQPNSFHNFIGCPLIKRFSLFAAFSNAVVDWGFHFSADKKPAGGAPVAPEIFFSPLRFTSPVSPTDAIDAMDLIRQPFSVPQAVSIIFRAFPLFWLGHQQPNSSSGYSNAKPLNKKARNVKFHSIIPRRW